MNTSKKNITMVHHGMPPKLTPAAGLTRFSTGEVVKKEKVVQDYGNQYNQEQLYKKKIKKKQGLTKSQDKPTGFKGHF
jgi:hypothetical protein